MNPLKKLLGQTAIYGLSSIIGRLLNYFLVPLYTRVFSTSEYGVVTEMYAYVAFFIVLLTYGMETALFKFSKQYENDKQKVYSTALISLLISSSVFIAFCSIFSDSLSGWMGYGDHSEYIVWFAFIIGLDAITALPFAKLREENQAERFALIKVFGILINIALNLFFIVYCPYVLEKDSGQMKELIEKLYNPEVGVGYIFIANLVASAAVILLLMPKVILQKYFFDKTLWKSMMLYAMPLVVAGFAGMINETLDRIILKYLLPEDVALSELGIYGACYKVAILMTISIQAFRFASEPFFFSHSDKKDSAKTFAKIMNYFVAVCSGIFLAIMCYMDIIQYFIGEEFRVGLGVVPILLVANIFLGIYFNLSIWYKLSGKTYFGAIISLLGAFITLSLNFALIPWLGYYGSAWATLSCYLIMAVVSYNWGKKHYPVPYNLKKIIFYITFSLFLYLLTVLINIENQTLRLIVHSLYLVLFVTFVYIIEKPKKSVHAS